MNYELIIALAIGWLLDLLFGDPERLPHPVVGMGRWIAFWEKRLNKGGHRRTKGALLVVVSLLLVFGLTALLCPPPIINYQLSIINCQFLTIVLAAFLIFFCLAGHTLRREVRMVFEALDRSLGDGRQQVARIVGRDTQSLSAQEVRTAALETLAENLSDGVVAPLFWLCLLGVPGMVTYKLVNTFDSMIGYRTPRYKDFGCWAARIDDVANFIPARLTALLMLIVGTVIPKSEDMKTNKRGLGDSFRFLLHFGPQHASPNSGWPEAALAVLLDCRFGGPHDYFGEEVYKPYIGNNPRPLTTADMRFSLRLSLCTELLVVLLTATILLLLFIF